MHPIPPKLRAQMSESNFYSVCALRGHTHKVCAGRITWEHALTYAGRQVQEAFAIVPICAEYHLGKGLDKRRNIWVALNRASLQDFKKYEKADWKRQLLFLNRKYGKWKNLNAKVHDPCETDKPQSGTKSQ